MLVREYVDYTDKAGILRCVEALQDFERALVPSMPPGSEIAEAYVADMLNKCVTYAGKLLVLEVSAEIAGFVSLYTRMVSDDLDDGPEEFAYIGDLIILENFSGRGFGRRLLNEAEAVAVREGARKLRIGVLADNRKAYNLYCAMDYKPFAVQLEKAL